MKRTILATCLFVMASACAAMAQGIAVTYPTTVDGTLGVGSTFTVPINADSGTAPFNGFYISVHYDPAVLSGVSISTGAWFAGFGSVWIVSNVVDGVGGGSSYADGPGVCSYGAVLLGTMATGSGNIFTLTLKVKAASSATPIALKKSTTIFTNGTSVAVPVTNIPFGYFSNKGSMTYPTADAAITAFSVTVPAGAGTYGPYDATMTVKNQGSVSASLGINIFQGPSPYAYSFGWTIATTPVLPAGTSYTFALSVSGSIGGGSTWQGQVWYQTGTTPDTTLNLLDWDDTNNYATTTMTAATASVVDVAVSAVTPSSTTSAPVGTSVTLSATVSNLGTGPASCTVNFKAGTVAAGSATVTGLAPGASIPVSIAWSTAGLALGAYAISASIPPLAGETITSNNTAAGGTVWLTTAPSVTLAGHQAWAGKNFISLSTTSIEDLFGKIKNIGTAPATVRVKFTIAKGGSAYDTEYSGTATIFPGLTAILSDSFGAAAAGVGSYSVTAIAQADIGGTWTDMGSAKTFGFTVNP